MLNRPKQEETIFYNGTLFHKGDIVTIKTIGTYGKEHTGRISGVDNSHFFLDMSEQYRENIQRFEYDDIEYIKYVAEPDVSASTDSEGRQGGQA